MPVWLSFAIVPLLGSLSTEPAAMTIAALMLAPQVSQPSISERVKYVALGALFANMSIGGTFLGFTQAYEKYQSPLLVKEALLVAFFLAGLVLLGGMQRWWQQRSLLRSSHLRLCQTPPALRY